MAELQLPLLWIGESEVAAMAQEARDKYPLETGGVLLGYGGHFVDDESPTSRDIFVSSVVGPGPRALHQRHEFVPDHAFHREEVARLYESSGRIWRYLGDWHTHPDAPAYLSSTDTRTLERISKSSAARASSPIMMILGQVPEAAGAKTVFHIDREWYLCAWNYVQSSLCVRIRRSARGRATPFQVFLTKE